jgi:hypothetical protein
MTVYDDEFSGQGGTFEVRKGRRVLVSQTAPAGAPADVDPPSDNAAPEPPNAAEGSD